MLLTLPVLDPAIPAEIEFNNRNTNYIRLALAMSQNGMIGEEDLTNLRRSLIGYPVLKRLIETGWMRECSDLFRFEAISAYATLVLPSGDGNGEGVTYDADAPMCGVVINAGQPKYVIVQPVMEALENLLPGLGCAALRILDHALAHFCTPFTPEGAFYMCEHLYWMGEADESVALEEYGEHNEDVPRRAALFEGIPEWAYDWHSKHPKISAAEFSRCAKRFAKRGTGPILALLDRLNTLLAAGKYAMCEPPEEFECCEPMVCVAWTENDSLSRVFDDYWQCSAEAESAPYMGIVRFALDADEIENALPRIRHTGLMLRALDEALVAIEAWSR